VDDPQMNTIGIDFGTSNSVAVISSGDGVRFAEFPDGRIGNPTVIYFPGNRRDYYIGAEGIDTYFDDLEHGLTGGRLMFSIKTLLPDEKFDHTLVSKHGHLAPSDLCGRYLLKLKAMAEAQFERDFDRAVLGRPVDFSDFAVDRLEKAARIAGFKEVEFVLEPLAAAAAYKSESVSPELVFVVDLGGGTSDTCIVEVNREQRFQIGNPEAIKAVGGIRVAGDALSARIFLEKLGPRFGAGSTYMSLGRELPFPVHIIQKLSHWSRVNLIRAAGDLKTIAEILTYSDRPDDVGRLLTLVKDHLAYETYKAVEAAKIELSFDTISEIRYSRLSLKEPISRTEFEQLCGDIFGSIRNSILETCRSASIDPGRIDKVLLTGGTSQIPYIQQTIEDIFAPEKIMRPGFFSSVASGLGHLAGQAA
jgi:hypothetical chaperone protein